ncbi:MAG: XRE family transcriptional regulator [Solirubrobacteraceae bacterium]
MSKESSTREELEFGAPPGVDSGLDQIGRRLNAMRRAQGATLEQLASDSGLSTGYLSQIETGTAIPSLTALQLIAAELGVDVTAFFPDERIRGTRLIRASERHEFRVDPGSGEQYAVLAGQVHDRAFSALYARLEAASEGNERPFRHLGEEFALVLGGRLLITVEGTEYELGPGDWIHYSSHPSHSLRVVSDEPMESLWLLTPAVI